MPAVYVLSVYIAIAFVVGLLAFGSLLDCVLTLYASRERNARLIPAVSSKKKKKNKIYRMKM